MGILVYIVQQEKDVVSRYNRYYMSHRCHIIANDYYKQLVCTFMNIVSLN